MTKIFWLIVMIFFSHYTEAQQKKNPNIIYIYADDMGFGELGCYGQQKIKTPNLDKLASEGMRFTQHYSSAPVCAPARCMLMTGKHSGHAYIRGNYELGGFEDDKEGGQMPLPEGTFTIAKMLKNVGYATGMIGKWGLGMNNNTGNPNQQGFDYFYGYLDQKQAHNYYPTHLWENGKWDKLNNPFIYVHHPIDSITATDKDFDYFKGNDYAPEKMTEKALNFIDKNAGSPFFLYLPYTIPHVSLQVPDDYLKKYVGMFNESPYYGQRGYAATRFPLSAHAAMITYLDDQVGIILKKIKELGLDKNTIIMFSSDNGASDEGDVNIKFFDSNHGLRGEKRDLYEGGIREPFIARWPGKIPAGVTSKLISAQYDLMATLTQLTGAKAWANDGISFLPTLLGHYNQQRQHEFLYFEFPEKSGQVAIRMGKWKGVKSNMKKNKNASWEIYDLDSDEKETNNMAAQHPDLVKRFEEILKQQHQPSHLREWEFVDPKFKEEK
ncbi:MAG: arylsulfatase [Bacteroidetes bacterium]|nr:arylsulfatase [Bacteroidota bacterium]